MEGFAQIHIKDIVVYSSPLSVKEQKDVFRYFVMKDLSPKQLAHFLIREMPFF